MPDHFFKFKLVQAGLLMFALFYLGSSVMGNDRDRKRGGDRGGERGRSREEYRENRRYKNEDRREYRRRYNKIHRHYYRDGRWYRPGWFGLSFAVSVLTNGTMIDELPPKHTTVIIQGIPYYHDDRYYYRTSPEGGYVVVQSPVIVKSEAQMPEMSTVNIPNSRCGYTSVTLRKSGNGFIGPQGEYYSEYPSVEQLKAMYGN